MRYIPFFVLLLIGIPLHSYCQQNSRLKNELDSMYVLDQRNREWLTKLGNNQPLTDSLSTVYKVDRANLAGRLWAEQTKIDTSNLARAEAILKEQGYPGKSVVGTPTNEAVFYIIQHSNKIDRYLPVIKKAADQEELPFYQYAMMLDRSLMYGGKPQLYGTQVSCRQLKSTRQSRCFVWPITNAKDVNTRRKQAGFDLTVEENANRLNAAYEPASTVEEIRKMYVF
ncbi:DUF6624 domain-containing protein [Spirosoma fluviale]|uniref:Uncharacterized protein n=1 Tax=Spirosoma fluviale TaxID=1597977 RepID=A0A286F6U4_9BACT|nr:DUF6624 domain-containing protein [Spirosoma fluviale]SOD78947.1 hypothetical protein SAMN06269250_0721 [Spirosoma fluviale]